MGCLYTAMGTSEDRLSRCAQAARRVVVRARRMTLLFGFMTLTAGSVSA